MFTYAILSHFMEFVYSLMNECVNQFTAVEKDEYKLTSLERCLWVIHALRKTVSIAVSNSLVC